MDKAQKILVNVAIYGFLVMLLGIAILVSTDPEGTGFILGKIVSYLGCVALCLGVIFLQLFPSK